MTDEIDTSSHVPSEIDAELKERFELLPEDLQKVILDSGYTTTLFHIAKANKLTYEQLETLQLETLMAFLGMNKPDEYREFLQDAFKKSDAEMDVIIQAVNEQVFDPVRDSLHHLYSSDEGDSDIDEDEEEEENATEDEVDEQPSSSGSPEKVNSIPINIGIPKPVQNIPPTVAPSVEVKMQPIVPQATTITPSEKTVLGSAGIVLGESQNNLDVKQDAPVVQNREDLIKSIENPVRNPSATIVANKLSVSSTLMPNKTTDYSLPKTTPQSTTPASAPVVSASSSTPASTQKGNDGYREKI